MPFPSESLELARLRALGQVPPDDVEMEGPNDYIDPAEQRLLLPRGLGSAAHQGGLQSQALLSRLRDVSSEGSSGGPSGTVPSAEEASLRQRGVAPGGPEASAAVPRPTPTSWMTNDPAAMAKADKLQRQSGMYALAGKDAGRLIRLAATAYAGGAAGGGGGFGGGGAGAAQGTEAGASSGAGFGSNFSAGFQGGGGTGAGGYLGRLSSQYLQNQGSGGGGGSGMMGMGSGGGGGDKIGEALDQLAMQRKKAALAAAGMLPGYESSLVSDAGGPIWSTAG